MSDREAWLNGWPRMQDTVLLGTGVHCAGCGAFQGVTTVAFSDDYVSPTQDPDWPFSDEDCPLCVLRHRKERGRSRYERGVAVSVDTNPARTTEALRLAAYLADDVSVDDLAQKLEGYVDLDGGVVDVVLGGWASESRDQREDARILAAILLRYLEGRAK